VAWQLIISSSVTGLPTEEALTLYAGSLIPAPIYTFNKWPK